MDPEEITIKYANSIDFFFKETHLQQEEQCIAHVIPILLKKMNVNDFYGFLVVTCIFPEDFLFTHF